MAEQGIREQIASELAKRDGFFDSRGWAYQPNSVQTVYGELADQILNIKCSRGGGVCPECKGKCTKLSWNMIDCPTCKGTGQKPIETKTLDQIVKEFEDG